MNNQFMAKTNSQTQDDDYDAMAFVDGKFFGAKASITVHEPNIDLGSKANSGGWIALGNGRNTYDQISAGWFVWPKYYNDKHARFTILWSSTTLVDDCVNLFCPGFVQVSSDIPLGAQLSPVSSYGGEQKSITIQIFKDPKTGDWWLAFGENKKLIRYWPKSLFRYLNNEASKAGWGGVVLGPEPTPAMGSGHFSSEGFQKSAFVDKAGIIDENNNFVVPKVTTGNIITDKPECYTVSNLGTSNDGVGFYFGEPVCNS